MQMHSLPETAEGTAVHPEQQQGSTYLLVLACLLELSIMKLLEEWDEPVGNSLMWAMCSVT